MHIRRTITIAAVLSFSVLVGIVVFQSGSFDDRAEEAVDPTPGTTGDYENLRGQQVSLETFQHTPRIITVWASWCPLCVDELAALVELQRAHQGSIVVVAINRAEPESIAHDFAERLGIADDLVVLYDEEDKYFRSIGGYAMPETLFIAADDDIVFHKRGPLSHDELQEYAAVLLQ